jgi:hypothetical protein
VIRPLLVAKVRFHDAGVPGEELGRVTPSPLLSLMSDLPRSPDRPFQEKRTGGARPLWLPGAVWHWSSNPKFNCPSSSEGYHMYVGAGHSS